MKLPAALRSGGFAAAACTACCAPPIIAALGLTAGLAATVGIFLGLAAAVAVVLVGAGWVIGRRRSPDRSACTGTARSVPVSLTIPRATTSSSTCCDAPACTAGNS